jgi:hypothetical protein
MPHSLLEVPKLPYSETASLSGIAPQFPVLNAGMEAFESTILYFFDIVEFLVKRQFLVDIDVFSSLPLRYQERPFVQI